MDIKMFIASLLAVFGLIAPLQAGNGHHNNGGNVVSGRSSAGRSGAPSFSSMPARSFGGNRAMYSGQRFSSFGTRSSNAVRFHPQSVNNFGAQQFARGNFQANRFNHLPNTTRIGRSGNGFASSNRAIGNQRLGSGQMRNAQGRLAPNWRNHVVAQRSGNFQNWNHHSSHWWHGHRWCFIGGSWFAFDAGFWPFWPWWWDYPYYSYGYGYPYDSGYGYGGTYGYDYNNDPGVYDSQPAYQNGYEDQSGYQNGPDDQSSYRNRSNVPSANSTVAGAQDRLTQDGFYHGQIDGVLGPETRHAIVRFQTKHGLAISGELTRETLNAMGLRQYANY